MAIGRALQVLGIIIFFCGVISAIKFIPEPSAYPDYTPTIFLFGAGLVFGLTFVGFGELIVRVTSIEMKLDKRLDSSRSNQQESEQNTDRVVNRN